MGSALRAAITAFKKSRHEVKEKSRLLRKDIDYLMFQRILNSLADDQQKIGIDICLSNGTIIKIRKEQPHGSPLRDPYVEVIK